MRPSHLIGFEWQDGGLDFNSGTVVSSDIEEIMSAPATSVSSIDIDLSLSISTGDFKYFFGIIDLFKLKTETEAAVTGNHHLIQIEKDVDDQIEINVNGKNLGGSDHQTSNMPRYRATVVTGRYLYFDCLYIDLEGSNKCKLNFERKKSW